jgi:hypothetical protein
MRILSANVLLLLVVTVTETAGGDYGNSGMSQQTVSPPLTTSALPLDGASDIDSWYVIAIEWLDFELHEIIALTLIILYLLSK